MRFGAFELDIVSDGTFRLDGGAMFGVVPRVLWEKKFAPDDKNRITLGLNCLLVRTGAHTVLIESGIGSRWDEKERGIYAIAHETSVAEGLARLGVAPAEVDLLILTHLHFDHAGGATLRREGGAAPAFPNATLFIQKEELEHARMPYERDRASYRPEDWESYAAAGRLETVDGEAEIIPGVSVEKIRGHNAGMQGVRVASEGQTAFYFGDAIPTTAHLPPAWTMGYDLYPVELGEAKKRLLARAASEGWLCVFVHDPRLPWGRVVQEGHRFSVAPVPPSDGSRAQGAGD
jgi:glyoxylase-like metal-dependent hydrolase (beta-lactamase superfamily II)